MRRKKKRLAAGAGFLALCMGVFPMQAAAASPEFAYTQEKWETLQDNCLEFEEISDLIHEYNNTVQQNLLDYNDYRGKTSTNISREYYNSADDILENIEYPSDDDAGYASRLSSALSSQIQAENLVKQGDNNVDDGEIIKLGYDQQEAQLVKQAQELMISYWNQTYSLDTLKKNIEQAENSYASVLTKVQAGMAVQADVEAAAESVTKAKASLLSAEKSLEQTKEQLCLMLGWPYGADVEISPLPEPDLESIEAIDVEADIETALSSSYDIKMTARRIDNAASATIRESQQKTYDSQRETASTSVKNAYNSLILAKSDYEQAAQSYELEKSSLAAAQTRLAAGTITKNAYQDQEASCLSAQINTLAKTLNLLKARLNYDWAVNGLASTA